MMTSSGDRIFCFMAQWSYVDVIYDIKVFFSDFYAIPVKIGAYKSKKPKDFLSPPKFMKIEKV